MTYPVFQRYREKYYDARYASYISQTHYYRTVNNYLNTMLQVRTDMPTSGTTTKCPSPNIKFVRSRPQCIHRQLPAAPLLLRTDLGTELLPLNCLLPRVPAMTQQQNASTSGKMTNKTVMRRS